MRLIDADELKTAFPASENSTPVLIASVRATINHMPTIELERKRGKWIYNSPVTMKCDQCGYVIKDWRWNELNFCANCGADMRGEQDE